MKEKQHKGSSCQLCNMDVKNATFSIISKISDIYFYTYSYSIEMGEQPLVKTVANIFRKICYANRDQMTAGIICAGWDKREGGQVMMMMMMTVNMKIIMMMMTITSVNMKIAIMTG